MDKHEPACINLYRFIDTEWHKKEIHDTYCFEIKFCVRFIDICWNFVERNIFETITICL